MSTKIKWIENKLPKTNDAYLSIMSFDEVKKARNFHLSFPQYEITPLVNLKHMAEFLGIKGLYVKDESFSFNLNAFKVLGA